MHCSRVQELLSAFCDYQLTGAEMLEVSEHLESCPACERERTALTQVRSLLRALPVVEADRPFDPGVLKAQPRLKFDLPEWYYEGLERLRLATLGFRRAACHLATGAALGISVFAVSALQAPLPPNAARAHVPTDITSEAEPPTGSVPMAPEMPAPRIVPRFAAVQPDYAVYSASPALLTVSVSAPGWNRPRRRMRALYSELNGYLPAEAELLNSRFGLYR